MGGEDLFREKKKLSTEQALALYPQLRRQINDSGDPFETAVRLSIAGNIIDLGVQDTHADLEETIVRSLREPLAVDHLSKLRERVNQVEEILYLGDNAGETVFDRLLIEVLPVPVTYAVRGGPSSMMQCCKMRMLPGWMRPRTALSAMDPGHLGLCYVPVLRRSGTVFTKHRWSLPKDRGITKRWEMRGKMSSVSFRSNAP